MFGGIGGWGENDRGEAWSLYKPVCSQHKKQPVKRRTTFGTRNLLFTLTACREWGEGGSTDIKKPNEGKREVRGLSRQLNRLTQPSNRFDL